MEEWLRSTFLVYHRSLDDGNGEPVDAFAFRREELANGEATSIVVMCPIHWFVEHFGGVEVPPSASGLKALDPTDSLGWHRHFDEWVRQGIIQP